MADLDNFTFEQCYKAHLAIMELTWQIPVSYTGLNDRINRYGWDRERAIRTPKLLIPKHISLWERFISLFKKNVGH